MYIYIYISLHIYNSIYKYTRNKKFECIPFDCFDIHCALLARILKFQSARLKRTAGNRPTFWGLFLIKFSEIPKITFKKIWEENRHQKTLEFFVPLFQRTSHRENFRGRCTCGPQGWQQPRNDQRWSGVCSSDGRSHCCCSLAKKNPAPQCCWGDILLAYWILLGK